MEKFDLTKILKDCPNGTELWSPIFGEVTFKRICDDEEYPIVVEGGGFCRVYFTKDGKYYDYKDAECVLFPSRENRDWSTFKVEQPKPKFEPFQKVLVRNSTDERWQAQIYSLYKDGVAFPHYCVCGSFKYCIPYKGNEALHGTTNKPKEQWV